MSRTPNRMIRKGKSAFVYFVAAVIVSCYLVQTIDCLRLKKTERREGRKEPDAAKTTAFQEGRILFGRAFESQDIDGTKKSNDSSEDDLAYQADYAGWSALPVQDLSSREALWRRMTPSLQCGKDQLKFRAVGPGVTHFKIEQGNAPPMPLSQVPPSCGYTMQRNPFALVMQVPYDGCNMVQEGGHYMLPMHWQGVPVSLVCPKPQSPPAPQMLVYPPSYPQMPVQQHYSKTPDMSQPQQYPSYPQQHQQYPSYPQQHQQYPPYPQQYPSYPQQHQQYPSYPQQHQQYPSYPQQHQQYPSYPQQHQQYPSYPKQQQQFPSYPQHQQFPHFPGPSKAPTISSTPVHPAYPYPFYPYYYPSFQWPQKGPQQTTTPTTTQPTTTTPPPTTTTTATTTTTPPPTTTTTTTTQTTKSTTKPPVPQYPPYIPYLPPYPFPPFVPPFPQLPTVKPTTTEPTTTKAPQTASPVTPSPPFYPPHFHPHGHSPPFRFLPFPANYPPPPYPQPPMFRP